MNEKEEPRGDRLTTADLAGRGEQSRTVPVTGGETAQVTAEDAARVHDEQAAPLLSENQANDLRTRWDGIQAGFVDEPRKAVQAADNLVAEAMKRLAETFADERAKLEGQWDRGDDVSTEDLRLALRRYRSFFQRLLKV
jgi:hypothetical protein